MTQTKTWWFLETDDGEWLENEPHGTLTRDPNRALKWPNQTAADDFRRHLRHPWWGLKVTEHAWIETALRSPDLLAENTRLRAVNAGLVEALKEAESVFALGEQPRGKDRDHGPEVTEIGRRIGFGALMSSAQASWREYATERGHAGSEFVAGPCYSTVISTLNMIRAALRAAEEASQ